MPEISVNVETTVDVDVDIIEIIEECSNSEIEDVLDYLEENDFIKGKQRVNQNATYDEIEFYKNVDRLSEIYLQITPEDWETIQKLIKKY